MKWYTVAEAATILRASRNTVYLMCAAGRLNPTRRVGVGRGKILISEDALSGADSLPQPSATPKRERRQATLKHLKL